MVDHQGLKSPIFSYLNISFYIGIGRPIPKNGYFRCQLFYLSHIVKIAIIKSDKMAGSHFLNELDGLLHAVGFWLYRNLGRMLLEKKCYHLLQQGDVLERHLLSRSSFYPPKFSGYIH